MKIKAGIINNSANFNQVNNVLTGGNVVGAGSKGLRITPVISGNAADLAKKV